LDRYLILEVRELELVVGLVEEFVFGILLRWDVHVDACIQIGLRCGTFGSEIANFRVEMLPNVCYLDEQMSLIG